MFKINRKIEYALIALKHMSAKSPGQLTSSKEICDIYNTPFDPTSRVLQMMATEGVLAAEQGAKGGYQIVKDLTKMSLKDLSDIIIGAIEIVNCFHDDSSNCEMTCSCQIISPMLNLNEEINKIFGNIKVAQLLESKHQDENTIRAKQINESVESSKRKC